MYGNVITIYLNDPQQLLRMLKGDADGSRAQVEIEGQLGDVVVTHRKNEPEMVPQKYSKAFQIQCE